MYIIHRSNSETNFYHVLGITNIMPLELNFTVTEYFPDRINDRNGISNFIVNVEEDDDTLSDNAIIHLIGEGGQLAGAEIVLKDEFLLRLDKYGYSQRVKRLRDEREGAGVETGFGIIDTDADSQRKIVGATVTAMLAKSSDSPFSIDWRMKDNSIVTLDADQMIAIGLLVSQHVAECQTLKNQLDARIALSENYWQLHNIFAEEWPPVSPSSPVEPEEAPEPEPEA